MENGFVDAGTKGDETFGSDDDGVNETANGFKAGEEKDNFGSLEAEVFRTCWLDSAEEDFDVEGRPNRLAAGVLDCGVPGKDQNGDAVKGFGSVDRMLGRPNRLLALSS